MEKPAKRQVSYAKETVYSGLLTMLTLGLLLLFNNCGSPASETNYPDPIVSKISIEEMMALLPENEKLNPILLAESVTHPQLLDNYPCPNDTNGVVICHFPVEVDKHETVCVNKTMLTNHLPHTRSFTKTGDIEVISDYFGPCRLEL